MTLDRLGHELVVARQQRGGFVGVVVPRVGGHVRLGREERDRTRRQVGEERAAQAVDQLARRRPLRGVDRQASPQSLLEEAGDLGRQRRVAERSLGRRRAAEQGNRGRGEAVDVGGRRRCFACRHLGCREAGCAARAAGRRRRPRACDRRAARLAPARAPGAALPALRDAEVHEDDVPGARQHAVGRLHVAVDRGRVVAVQVFERVRYLREPRDDHARPEPGRSLVAEDALKVGAVDPVHRDRVLRSLEEVLAHHGQPGVRSEREKDAGLGNESFARRRRACRTQFDRDQPVVPRVVGLDDLALPATPDDGKDFVATVAEQIPLHCHRHRTITVPRATCGYGGAGVQSPTAGHREGQTWRTEASLPCSRKRLGLPRCRSPRPRHSRSWSPTAMVWSSTASTSSAGRGRSSTASASPPRPVR